MIEIVSTLKYEIITGIASILTSVIISLIAMMLNFKKMKKEFDLESLKMKKEIQLSRILALPIDYLNLFDELFESNISRNHKKHKEIINKFRELQSFIFSYGSKDSIKILSKMQQLIYQSVSSKENENNNKHLYTYFLLASQLKYDLSEEIVSPVYWYRIKIKDSSEIEEKMLVSFLREVTDELDLKINFLIEDNNQHF